MPITDPNDILDAAANYGKAQTAFGLALVQAANAREQAMIGLGADFTTQGGTVITPDQGGKMLGGEGFPAGTKMSTGFGEGALPTITKTQAGAVYQQQEALVEKGVGTTSGVSEQSKLITQDQGALETQAAVQDFQGKVAEANLSQATAKAEKEAASADLATEQGVKLKGKKKPTGKPSAARQAQLASARAAANQKAKAAGKPLPYGKGGTVKPKSGKKG